MSRYWLGHYYIVRQILANILKSFLLKPFDEAASDIANQLSSKYLVDKSSKPYDLLIAAHALSLKCPIITSNTKDYTFNRLKVVDFNAL